jgi:hypothetical protein
MRSGLILPPCLFPEPAHSLRCGLAFLFLFGLPLFGSSTHQEFSDFTTPLPLPKGDMLVLGIVGGWERWDAPHKITRRICLHLRELHVPGVHVETVRELAHELITKAFDRDANGVLDDAEKRDARIIIYGQSLGGSATVRLCRWLNERQMPVRLSVQIDSVGFKDGKIPPNVKEAANLYQHDISPIIGVGKIKAQDKSKTKILGNWRYSYPPWRFVDTSEEPMLHKVFMNSHIRMEYDPLVWVHVEGLILKALFGW